MVQAFFFFSNNSNIKILARRSSFFDPTRHQPYAQKERFHMTSQLPCWCSKPVLWGVVSFLRQTLSFVPINLHRRWSRKWKYFIKEFPFLSLNDTSNVLCCVMNLCCKTCNWKIKIYTCRTVSLVIIQMKLFQQYFHTVPSVLYVVLTTLTRKHPFCL